MPSMAAAIITPARLDFDSRTSSVIIALPAPSDISSARLSSPADRHALAGSRRNSARKAGSASSRSISWAAISASDAATSLSAEALGERLGDGDDHGDEEADPERDQHGPHHVGGRELLHDRLVAQREADRKARHHDEPGGAEDRVAREHGGVTRLGRLAGQPAGELGLGAAAQAGLAEDVDEDLVAVAVDERVEVEEGADVGGEREVEEDVAYRARGQQQAAQREDRPDGEVRHGPGGADRDAPLARLEPGLAGVHERVGEDEQQLQAGALDLAAEGGHRHPVGALVDRDHDEAPGEEHQAAEPDLRRDHEWRPVTADDQVGEDAQAGRGEHGH